MTDERRDAVQAGVTELMRQYDDGEIDRETYVVKMIEFIRSVRGD